MEAETLEKVFLYPANIHVSLRPVCIATLLGTCVAVCLWDTRTKIGGMNHYLLPLWNGEGLASPKYGNIAIEKLISKMESYGANRRHMVGKIFGGRAQHDTRISFNIGERNAQIAKQMMSEYGIPVVAENVVGEHGMNIRFDTSTGVVKLKYIKGNIR
ncbi:chemotaxis protein CheD [Pseudochryseolinea flava]|uniref:Probable chemoreceptor glutamine deamidase CheD n=1 Tax=Pseudochryseolinea flava TaxID=2059302 RepID=A0A364Y318_9BACT|nr:chemotaxis protein CheD [Pseudochryseolinea flava]RAW00536.1 chemotaxis protein CheD [Pseudochryseolinea flava]